MAEPPERAWALDAFFAWRERQPERYESRLDGLGASIDLPTLGAARELRTIYDGVEFSNNPRLVTFEPQR